ncbi:putative amidoligase enzyme-domain-containing protein [Geopyxis carbonaria]|nr:putative amidoligase enzyme-domain-containing protein [Geopyxis carbonaria]
MSITDSELRRLRTQSPHAGDSHEGQAIDHLAMVRGRDKDDYLENQMKERLRKFVARPEFKPSTFGIELEGFTCRVTEKHDHQPPRLTRPHEKQPPFGQCVWKDLKTHLEEKTPNKYTVHEADDTSVVEDPTYSKWTIIQDGSIWYKKKEITKLLPERYKPEGTFPDIMVEHTEVEMNSPILDLVNLDESITQIKNHVNQLRFSDQFYTSYNKTCGIHVHIGCGLGNIFMLSMLKRIALVCVICEYGMDQLFARHRYLNGPYNSSSRRRYIFGSIEKRENDKKPKWYPMKVAEIYNLINGCKSTFELCQRVYGSRVSFRNLDQKGTIEFREHEMTLDAIAIEMYIRLMAAMMNTIANATDAELKKKLLDPFGDGSEYQWPRDRETDYEDERLLDHNSLVQFLKHFVGIPDIENYYRGKAENNAVKEKERASTRHYNSGSSDSESSDSEFYSSNSGESSSVQSDTLHFRQARLDAINRYNVLKEQMRIANTQKRETPERERSLTDEKSVKDIEETASSTQPFDPRPAKPPLPSTPQKYPPPRSGPMQCASRGTNPLPNFKSGEIVKLVCRIFNGFDKVEMEAFLDEIGMPASELHTAPRKRRR